MEYLGGFIMLRYPLSRVVAIEEHKILEHVETPCKQMGFYILLDGNSTPGRDYAMSVSSNKTVVIYTAPDKNKPLKQYSEIKKDFITVDYEKSSKINGQEIITNWDEAFAHRVHPLNTPYQKLFMKLDHDKTATKEDLANFETNVNETLLHIATLDSESSQTM